MINQDSQRRKIEGSMKKVEDKESRRRERVENMQSKIEEKYRK